MKAFNSELKVEGGKVFCGEQFLFELPQEQAKTIAHAVNRYGVHIKTIKSLSDTIEAINGGFSKPGASGDLKEITFVSSNGSLHPIEPSKKIGNTTRVIKAISDDGYVVLCSTQMEKEDVNAGDYEARPAYVHHLRTKVTCLNPDENFYQTGAYSRNFKVIEVSK